MKYLEDAWSVAEEFANILVHNKYLLEDVETLKVVLYNKFATTMGKAYRSGTENIHINDLSHLILDVPQGAN